MTSFAALLLLLVLTLSPALLPLVTCRVHAIANLRTKPAAVRPATNPEPQVAVAV